jgi:hypothetical protein
LVDLPLYRKYVERVGTVLRACEFATDLRRQNFVTSAGLVSLNLEVVFNDESSLLLSESFVVPSSMGSLNFTSKKITYQYMDKDGALIFRIDCHGSYVPMEAPLHLDLPLRKHILDGDPILKGIEVSNADFSKIYGWICDRLAGEPLPWEDTDAKA